MEILTSTSKVEKREAPEQKCSDEGAQALWFDSGATKLFAWYHPSRKGIEKREAIVLCSTFGSEGMLLHPAYREFALELAAAGHPCLRFDYPGTCDSGGSPRDPDLLRTWVDSIHDAINLLKAISGTEKVGLFGTLLGGTLATLAASQRSDISSLIVWAPYLSGKNFLRATKLQDSVITANVDKKRCQSWQEGDSEAFGFLISKSFADGLRTIDLSQLTNAPALRVCVFARDQSSQESRLVALLGGLNVQVKLQNTSDDLVEVLAKLEIPRDLIQDSISWLHSSDSTSAEIDVQDESSKSRLTAPRRYTAFDVSAQSWYEETIFLGSSPKLFGIITRPRKQSQRKSLGILLINGGNNHRVGINRNYTEWSRNLADQGFIVLRFDIRGLGDSPALASQRRNTLYLESTLDDLKQSYDFLIALPEIERVAMLGLCGGAYQSFRFAQKMPDLQAIIMINPLRLQQPELGDEGIRANKSEQQLINCISLYNYIHFLLNIRNWRQLLAWRKGSLRIIRDALRNLFSPLLPADSPYKVNRSQLNSVANEFQGIVDNRTDIFLLCGEDESILPILQLTLSSRMRELKASGYFHLRTLDNTNHILAPLWSQEKAYSVISEHIEILQSRLNKGTV